jgi:hypothetical protein
MPKVSSTIRDQMIPTVHTRGHFYRSQLHDPIPDGNQQQQADRSFEEDIRSPRIHKSDPSDFHPSNVLPSVNHLELPLRCISQTMLWFVDGSGGYSQIRMSLCN